jgi:predicted metal-dependent enzyme (double-stranded beta helix superfamily)
MLTSTPPSAVTHTPALSRFIEGVRAIVSTDDNAARIGSAVAELLQPLLGREDLLHADQLEPDPTRYRQHVLHVEPDNSFSVVALIWLPGQTTCIHDHVSWCVVGVHTGQENETQYCVSGDTDDPYLFVCGQTVNPAGSVAALVPPGDIHDVANGGDTLAVSLHVYGANIATLGSSIRRRYDLQVRPAA